MFLVSFHVRNSCLVESSRPPDGLAAVEVISDGRLRRNPNTVRSWDFQTVLYQTADLIPRGADEYR